MKKNLGTIIAAAFLAVVLMLYMCTFQVRSTEVAIIKTWGKPAEAPIAEAGLHWKWPPPVQTLELYDNRDRILEDKMVETRTRDHKNLILTSFAIFRIADPVRFHVNFPDGIEEGEGKLRTTIQTHKQAVTGKHDLDEFISTDPDQRKLVQIEAEMRDLITADALDFYGVQIVEFGIKKLGLPESVTSAIFDRMRAGEDEKAASYTDEGNATAVGIVADAQAKEGRILAAARRKVAEIESDAQAQIGEYYKKFQEYPELRTFLDQLRTLELSMASKATLILSPEFGPPFDLFDPAVRDRVIPKGADSDAHGPGDQQEIKNPVFGGD